MAHGRVSVVLGVRSGLGAIIAQCQVNAQQPTGLAFPRPEFFSLLVATAQFDKILRREGVAVHWTTLGPASAQDLPALGRCLGAPIAESESIAFEKLDSNDFDALIYIPIDVPQPKQVEHLARLSMICPRVRHLCFAAAPKWNHSQLMALRETWEWIDPKHTARILSLAEDLGRLVSGTAPAAGASVTSGPTVRSPQGSPKEDSLEPLIITRSPRMKEVLALVDAVADTDSTIMISGDSGTGKELIAQRIHMHSHRRNAAIVAVNCGAIPEELLESELFGHMKGAFTGAVSNREGRFEAAENGTLFLDEIGEMGANLQVKLLRVLQTKKFEPVGSTKSKTANVRIIAATHRDLETEIAAGRFREDLYYRLNVIPIHIPALRERKEDVALLVDHFVRKFNTEKARRVTGVTRASLRALVAYDWPGNVREIENLMERMVILKSSGMIDVLDFPEKYRRQTLSEIEYDDLMNASKSFAAPAAAASQPSHSSSAAHNTSNLLSLGAAHVSREEDAMTGEEMTIKGPTTFSKGRIEQSSATAVTPQASFESNDEQGLESVLSSMVEGSITVEQALRLMADRVIFPVEGLDFNSVVDQFENILILQALERTGWNRNRAAGLLRLNRTTLVEKLKKKQLMPPLRYGGESILEGNA